MARHLQRDTIEILEGTAAAPPPMHDPAYHAPHVKHHGTERLHASEAAGASIGAELDRRLGNMAEHGDLHKQGRDQKAQALLERLDNWEDSNESARQLQRNRHSLLLPRLASEKEVLDSIEVLPPPGMSDVDALEFQARSQPFPLARSC